MTGAKLIVGLSGVAQSGKDSLGGFLVRDHGFERRSFADALRAMLYNLNPLLDLDPETIPDDDIPFSGIWRLQTVVNRLGWDRAKGIPEVRQLLQRLGTEAGRQVLGEDIWVKTCLRDVPDKTVVTDVRFPNEGDAIREMGGIIVRITRPGYEPINSHASDNSMSHYDFDICVENNRGLEDLADAADFVVKMAQAVASRAAGTSFIKELQDLGASKGAINAASNSGRRKKKSDGKVRS